MARVKARTSSKNKKHRQHSLKSGLSIRKAQTAKADVLYLLADCLRLLESLESNKLDLDRMKLKLRKFKKKSKSKKMLKKTVPA